MTSFPYFLLWKPSKLRKPKLDSLGLGHEKRLPSCSRLFGTVWRANCSGKPTDAMPAFAWLVVARRLERRVSARASISWLRFGGRTDRQDEARREGGGGSSRRLGALGGSLVSGKSLRSAGVKNKIGASKDLKPSSSNSSSASPSSSSSFLVRHHKSGTTLRLTSPGQQWVTISVKYKKSELIKKLVTKNVINLLTSKKVGDK